ncbi:MAG: hypothetical protein KGK10_02980 [Rhodospirillales bacterium]|nr:hypothetical protein [Rhodospirillales bacterium]
MTDAQRAYETKRAAKAGLSLDQWLAAKDRERDAARKAAAAEKPDTPKKPGLFSRLLDRAHKPL